MLRGIFEYAPDTIVVIDRQGRIERVNAQVERMFGYQSEELLGPAGRRVVTGAVQTTATKQRTQDVSPTRTCGRWGPGWNCTASAKTAASSP